MRSEAALRGEGSLIEEIRAGRKALAGANLCGADLAGVNLAGVDLSGADLSGADLSGAILFQANLEGARLHGATLVGAELTAANLDNVDLEEADASQAGFGRATLRGAHLFQARLSGATFSMSDLGGADLRCAHLAGARLREARLERADLTSADLRETDMALCRVRGATFNNADLRDARLRQLNGFERASWIGADIRDVNFAGAYRLRRFVADQNYIKEYRESSPLHRLLYYIWWATSDCGRSMLRWCVLILLQVLLFGALFSLVQVDYGEHRTWLSPFYFSLVTLTSLGYGDVVPASAGGQILAMAEVVSGYIMLGGLIAIFSNRVARRAE
jgi:uncharacterized protein YjbI with pentapeptide repeats